MKLKLYLIYQEIAFPFRMSKATVSHVCDCRLHVAYYRLKGHIIWPERKTMQQTMPQSFYDAFGAKVAVIVDVLRSRLNSPCPSFLRHRCRLNTNQATLQCFWQVLHHKGHFISEGWGTKSKHTTEHWDSGQAATRGRPRRPWFLYLKQCGTSLCKDNIPAFTKGKQQLSVSEATTIKIANVRIHVEKVIGLVRNTYATLKVHYQSTLQHVNQVMICSN